MVHIFVYTFLITCSKNSYTIMYYTENCYQHFHWSHIDLFCYFSHQLVTIPPVPWINCAHRSGVGILGTFITEWESGKSFCRRIFATKESAVHAATKLAEIASCYKVRIHT